MTPEAAAENEACEAVVIEFRSIMAQHDIAEPLLKLCDELAGRIKLRRLRARIDAHFDGSLPPGGPS